MIGKFYVMKDGTYAVSKNFQVHEFACKDGSEVTYIDSELVDVLQDIRNHFKRPVIINSAYRTPSYNKKVGGVNDSYHLQGKACDIVVNGIKPATVYKYLDEKYNNKYGVGLYPAFTHIDTRATASRW